MNNLKYNNKVINDYNIKENKVKEREKDEEKENIIFNIIKIKGKQGIKNNQYIQNKTEYNSSQNINRDNKLKIAIAYATDNKYIYPIIVSMTSLVDKAGNNTFYNIYIMHGPNFTTYSKNFLKNVENKYSDKCYITFINMGNKYQELDLKFRITTEAYYRLSLQDILPDVKRIIWMDGDTLVFDDLTELIQLDMKGKVVMGFLDGLPDSINSFGFKNATVLCSAVLLLDLESLRKYGYSQKIENFTKNYIGKLFYQDQTVINVVMQDRIGVLPPKYGVWAWRKLKKSIIDFNNRLKPWLKYNEEELLYAAENPAILHFSWPKPFWRKPTTFDDEWWGYARKTGFYDEIYKNSPIPDIKW